MVNKKAFFLTFIALFFLGIFFLYLQILQINQTQNQLLLESSSSVNADRFAQNVLDKYLPDLLYASTTVGLNTLLSHIAYSDKTVIPMQTQKELLYELITNGTMTSLYGAVNLNGKNLNDSTSQLSAIIKYDLQIPIDIKYLPDRFEIYQDDSWSINVSMIFIISLNQTQTHFENVTKLVTVRIPINQLYEPYSAYNRQLTLTKITPSSMIAGKSNLSGLKLAVINQTYIASEYAPDYLGRLSNGTNASTLGIYRFINPNITSIQPINRSYVDFLMLNESWNCSTTPLFDIDGISDNVSYDGFRLDDQTLVSLLNISASPSEYQDNKTVVCQ